jgi:hypothetical protein
VSACGNGLLGIADGEGSLREHPCQARAHQSGLWRAHAETGIERCAQRVGVSTSGQNGQETQEEEEVMYGKKKGSKKGGKKK